MEQTIVNSVHVISRSPTLLFRVARGAVRVYPARFSPLRASAFENPVPASQPDSCPLVYACLRFLRSLLFNLPPEMADTFNLTPHFVHAPSTFFHALPRYFLLGGTPRHSQLSSLNHQRLCGFSLFNPRRWAKSRCDAQGSERITGEISCRHDRCRRSAPRVSGGAGGRISVRASGHTSRVAQRFSGGDFWVGQNSGTGR